MATAIGLPRYKCFIGLSDEGCLAYGAERVLQGELPNRDFTSLQPPLSFYSVAVMYKIFGMSLEINRRLGFLIYAAIPIAIYFWARQVTRPIFAFTGALPALVMGMPFSHFVPYAVWQGIIITLIGALLIMRAVRKNSIKAAFLAGVVNALVMLCRQDQGFYLLIAISGYMAAIKLAKNTGELKPKPGKLLGGWAAGIAAILLPLGIYWLASGAMVPMIKQLIIFPLTTYAKTSGIKMYWYQRGLPLIQYILISLFYLPAVVAVLTALWFMVKIIRGRFYQKETSIVFIVILAILFYLQVVTRTDLDHLLIVLAPFFVLLGWWLGKLADGLSKILNRISADREIKSRASVTATVIVLLATAGVGWWFMRHTHKVWMKDLNPPMRKLQLLRAGLIVKEWDANFFETVVGTIQENSGPNQSILCLPYTPTLYFLSERHNPTRWNYLWPGDQSYEEHQTLIRQAKNDPPAVITVSSMPDLAPNIEYYAPVIVNYISSHYRYERTVGNTKIYLPPNKPRDFR